MILKIMKSNNSERGVSLAKMKLQPFLCFPGARRDPGENPTGVRSAGGDTLLTRGPPPQEKHPQSDEVSRDLCTNGTQSWALGLVVLPCSSKSYLRLISL